ncbi:MAG: sigma-70 family RNA polymerase sigma factor [Bacteroidia bacterium]|nr:sigma-70 family RNA polymerase sigma factor [Bacteroidia bacterium]
MLYNQKYNNHSDNELINIFLEEDDNTVVGVLYERYGHLVLGLCIKYLQNRDEAKDASIQIFSNLLSDLKKYKIEFFKSWLYVYSKNYCLMQLRKRQSQLRKELELRENPDLFMDSEDPEHLHEKEKQIALLAKAMELLNNEQKKCVSLFYLNNKSYNEIVEITGYSANEVKSYIQNGKRNLKIKMEVLLNEQGTK